MLIRAGLECGEVLKTGYDLEALCGNDDVRDKGGAGSGAAFSAMAVIHEPRFGVDLVLHFAAQA
jgi:hypothetical protein